MTDILSINTSTSTLYNQMVTPSCIICNVSNGNLCSSCHSIAYCSRKCQKLDWPLHKTICKPITTLPSQPSPSHKLAILFPVHSEVPQLIWINCERRIDDEDGQAWESADTQPFLDIEILDPKYRNAQEYKSIRRNGLRGFNLNHTVQVICRETFLVDGSTSNVCVRHTTQGQMTHDWRGPIVVMRKPGTAVDPLFYEDMKAGDLRIAIDYFLSYGKHI